MSTTTTMIRSVQEKLVATKSLPLVVRMLSTPLKRGPRYVPRTTPLPVSHYVVRSLLTAILTLTAALSECYQILANISINVLVFFRLENAELRRHLAASYELLWTHKSNDMSTAVGSLSPLTNPREPSPSRNYPVLSGDVALKSRLKVPSDDRDFRIVRKLGSMEQCIAHCNDRGVGDIVYALHLRSKVPVDDWIMEEALKQLMLRVQNLRLAIRQDVNKEYYFVEMQKQKIKFRSLGVAAWQDVFEDMLRTEYNAETGPLWQSRLLKMAPEEEFELQNGRIYHGYVLLLGFHHAITDGTSNAQFCTIFLEILNGLLNGTPLPTKSLELGNDLFSLVDPEHIKFNWSSPKAYVDVAKDAIKYGFYERSLYLERYPPKKVEELNEVRSRICTRELPPNFTAALLRRCKEERVTVSGAFTAASALAMHRLITKGNKTYDATQPTSFSIHHAVNLRRYFKQQAPETCGCYFNFFDDHITVEPYIGHFWRMAGDAAERIRTNVESGKALKKQRNLDFIFGYLYDIDRYAAFRSRVNSTQCEFSTSNLGALDRSFSGAGSPVEVVKVFRCTAMHFLPCLFTWFFQTFRGKFLVLLEYYTNFCSKEQAEEFIDLTMQALHEGMAVPTTRSSPKP